ncbi:RpiR family transcriptional regulator [Nocardioides albertanoniae]|uniref:RpiR family transcriptional regulator n=1 Tax=Nocardioides albertanoniae TaxID=1175486 RepID=A0A543A9R2_9ACTN|nr:MurR/RpiR family transcriptional regulator [Nocardioides albertanoniae]TQL69289.1 RpiR family transcriptional regulator [Nocardioides albertanoniae]
MTSAPVLPAIRAAMPRLNPSERAVAEVVLTRSEWAIEATTAEIAAEASVSTATVVRASQRLGFRGFPHLKVLLARDLGTTKTETNEGTSPLTVVRAFFADIADSASDMVGLLSEDQVSNAVELLANARSVLVAGTGVSSPVAKDIAMRLASQGLSTVAPSDHLDQLIRARLLRAGDVCIVVSGTGATAPTIQVAQAAVAAEASVIALTSFTGTQLTKLAEVELVTPQGGRAGFRQELDSIIRIPQLILGNAIVAALAARDPEAAANVRARVLEVVGGELDPQG